MLNPFGSPCSAKGYHLTFFNSPTSLFLGLVTAPIPGLIYRQTGVQGMLTASRYNVAARKLEVRLVHLGGRIFYPRGEADEQHPEGFVVHSITSHSWLTRFSNDASFVPWSVDLQRHLLEKFPLRTGVGPIPESVFLEPQWQLSMDPDASNAALECSQGQIPDSHWPDAEHALPLRKPANSHLIPLTVKVHQNARITPPSHWQDVRHVIFFSGTQITYEAGDVLTIYPNNTPADVELLLKAMAWEHVADKPMRLMPRSPSQVLPKYPLALRQGEHRKTLRDFLTQYLDITAIPRRSFFSTIAHFTSNEMHKERLLEFAKPEFIDELYDYTTRPRRSILEILQEFDSVKIPWQYASTVIPELRGRQFSIASGGINKAAGDYARFELAVAIVKYKTVIKKLREGVCTRYISTLEQGDQLNAILQKGSLGIRQDQAHRPVVLIGAGTGIAPFKSLLEDRLLWYQAFKSSDQSPNSGNTFGQAVLFFGCRNRDADDFFRDELDGLEKSMPLQVFRAYSRDQKEKIYVQELVLQQAELVFDLLHTSSGIVYVCGSSGNMPRAVRAALVEVFKRYGGTSQENAEEYLQKMEKEGRYKQETW